MSCKETLFGIVPDEWTVSTIGEVTELKQGLQISKKLRSEENGEGYIPLLKITDLPSKVFSEYVKDIPEGYIASEKDIIYTRTGQVGLVYKGVSGCVHNNCFKVIPNEDLLDREYLYYYLKSSRMFKNSNNIASGSVQKDLTHKAFKTVKIGFPSLIEQKNIGKILSSLDEKIELNNEMNKTLEEMAQALFKRWFVDFEFPNEEGKPYKSSGGEMVESELGMIPKGWKVKLISEVIDVKDGTHASPKPKQEGYALITSKHIKGESIDFKSANLISKKDYDDINKRSKVDTGDILISMIGTVGLIYLIQEKNINFAIKNVGLFKASQNKMISEYLYLFLKSNNMKNYIEERLAGTTQKYISLGELRKIKFVLPDDSIICKFNAIVKNIFDKKRITIEETEDLCELRDSLLPKLMSGEIRVKDMEASL